MPEGAVFGVGAIDFEAHQEAAGGQISLRTDVVPGE
jgi:hypothetical protein